jgi:hypothetical protein
MDVSHEGLFVESSTVFREGVLLRIMLSTRDGLEILLDGEVRWSKKHIARYSHKLKSGMGILIKKITKGEEHFQTFCPREECVNSTPLPKDG